MLERIVEELRPPNPSALMQLTADHAPKGYEVLDIGCSTGLFTDLLAQVHPDKQVFGVDINEKAITEAKRLRRQKNLRF